MKQINKMKQIILIIALFLTAFASMAIVTAAQKTGTPTITRVSVGYSGGAPHVFVIHGSNLCLAQNPPRVTIENKQLQITACRSESIVAVPEASAEPLITGTYVLKLTYDETDARAVTVMVDVAIGAQGEKGEKGDTGAPGSMGATGPMGPPGAAGSMTPGSAFYIQNQNEAAQSAASFRIDGTGAANIFNAGTQYNIGGSRVLSVAGTNNLFAGGGAGATNTTGYSNSFVGASAGANNTEGHSNSFYGASAGLANTTGKSNSSFGLTSGKSNTTGSYNSSFGAGAGEYNTTGNSNSFFGTSAGYRNTTGDDNVFVGVVAGEKNFTGSQNSFFGAGAGRSSTDGSNITLVGARADVLVHNLNFAAAIGAGATVDSDNTLVLGRAADTVRVPGNLAVTGAFTGNFTVPAANVTGALAAAQIPNLDAGKITDGTFDAARIPNFNASKITSGTFDAARLPNLSASYIQNTTTQQTANFNISGSGSVGGNFAVNGNVTQTGANATFTASNGFVTSGTLDTGAIPASGAGERMMFYPRKAAFRAGRVSSMQWDDANIGQLSVALGNNAQATKRAAFAAGESTTASGINSTALGYITLANGERSTAMGYGTKAGGYASTAIGDTSTAGGERSTAMGYSTEASGNFSTALGSHSSTNEQTGSFVYGDYSTSGSYVQVKAEVPNEFVVRAAGGFRFRTAANLSTGCNLPAGSGTWQCTSSRALKENFLGLDGADILARLRRVPVMQWNYKGEQPGIRHIGAFAEDFHREFRLGTDDKSIGLLDIAGVNLAATKAIDERVERLQTQVEAQRKRIMELKQIVCALKPDAAVCQEEK